MKLTKEQVADNRRAIIEHAARLYRERGIDGISVEAISKAAGLSYGSLYSQFADKDALIAECLVYGLEELATTSRRMKSPNSAIVRYLSAEHRDNPGRGCFLASLGSEMPRQTEAVRSRFTALAKGMLEHISSAFQGSKRSVEREDAAIATLCSMLGALVLSRAVNDDGLSRRVLSVNKRILRNGL